MQDAVYTFHDLFADLNRLRLPLSAIVVLSPAVLATAAAAARKLGKVYEARFLCELNVVFGVTVLLLELALAAYFLFALGENPLSTLSLLIVVAGPVAFAASLWLTAAIYPLGSLGAIRRIKSFLAALAVSGLVVYAMIKTRFVFFFLGRASTAIGVFLALVFVAYLLYRRSLGKREGID